MKGTGAKSGQRGGPKQARGPGAREVLAGLAGRIEPVRTGMGYRAGLLLAAAVMLVLPVVYVSLIAGVCYLIYLHATANAVIFETVHSARAAIVLYFGPIVAGAIVVLFMIKPLLARRVDDSVPLTLRRQDEPLLFEFVDRLCRAVGAPTPARIDVDLEVNASASFKGGWAGLLGNKLVLTFGLPLAAGLDTRQFAGVLAHELGHFAQGSAMRLSYIVRDVNAWFARIVYHRDQWDQSLVSAAKESHVAIMVVCWVALVVVWLTRRVLWCLMMVGHGACAFLLREMEYDADRHECRLAGSATFDSTFQAIRCLNAASGAAFSDLSAAWRERRLCDDLPALIRARQTDMPGEIRTALLDAGKDAKTGWFDSHPADAARSRAAAREAAPGLFTVEAPTTVLFQDFAELSRIATMLFYKRLGMPCEAGQLTRTDNLVAARAQVEQTHDALRAYFRGLIDPTRPVFPERPKPLAGGAAAAAERLIELRSKLLELEADAKAAASELDRSWGRALTLSVVKELRAAGIRKSGAKDPKLDAMSDASLQEAEANARRESNSAAERVERAVAVGMERLNLALSLEPAPPKPAAEAEADEYALADEAATGSSDLVFSALTAMRPVAADVAALADHVTSLGVLLSHVQGSTRSEPLVNAIVVHARKAAGLLGDVRRQLGSVRYPFGEEGRALTLAAYVVTELPPPNEIGKVAGAASGTVNAYRSLYVRLMSDLAHRAQKIEAGLGLPALSSD